MTVAETRAALRAWVVQHTGRVTADALTDTTALIEQRILTSGDVMELLLELERLRGAPVDVRRMAPGSFNSIATIVERFFPRDEAGSVRS